MIITVLRYQYVDWVSMFSFWKFTSTRLELPSSACFFQVTSQTLERYGSNVRPPPPPDYYKLSAASSQPHPSVFYLLLLHKADNAIKLVSSLRSLMVYPLWIHFFSHQLYQKIGCRTCNSDCVGWISYHTAPFASTYIISISLSATIYPRW